MNANYKRVRELRFYITTNLLHFILKVVKYSKYLDSKFNIIFMLFMLFMLYCLFIISFKIELNKVKR